MKEKIEKILDEAFGPDNSKEVLFNEILSVFKKEVLRKLPSSRGHNWTNVTDYGKGKFDMLSEVKEIIKNL